MAVDTSGKFNLPQTIKSSSTVLEAVEGHRVIVPSSVGTQEPVNPL